MCWFNHCAVVFSADTSSPEEEVILNLFVGDLREIVEERRSYRIDKTYVITEPELAFELGGEGL